MKNFWRAVMPHHLPQFLKDLLQPVFYKLKLDFRIHFGNLRVFVIARPVKEIHLKNQKHIPLVGHQMTNFRSSR